MSARHTERNGWRPGRALRMMCTRRARVGSCIASGSARSSVRHSGRRRRRWRRGGSARGRHGRDPAGAGPLQTTRTDEDDPAYSPRRRELPGAGDRLFYWAGGMARRRRSRRQSNIRHPEPWSTRAVPHARSGGLAAASASRATLSMSDSSGALRERARSKTSWPITLSRGRSPDRRLRPPTTTCRGASVDFGNRARSMGYAVTAFSTDRAKPRPVLAGAAAAAEYQGMKF